MFVVGLLLLATLGYTGAQTGVCYGRLGSGLPYPRDVVSLCNQNNIRRMRIFDPGQSTLQALGGSNIEVTLGVPNADLPNVAANRANANNWIRNNVRGYPNVKFRYMAVGNEVSPLTGTAQYANFLLPAITNIFDAISAAGLGNQIKVSTAIETGLVGNSYPPSAGTFLSEVQNFTNPIVQFLASKGAPLLVNVYPYFAYTGNPGNVALEYVLFTSSSGLIMPDGVWYQNLFDAILDATYSAVEKAGGSSVQIVVSETGWPSDGGGKVTSIHNARIYNNNLISHVNGKSGTPRRPGKSIEAYIFNLFDEDQKMPEYEKHFGLFLPNRQPKYPIFTDSSAPNPLPHPALGPSGRQKSTWKLKLSIGFAAAFLAALALLSWYCITRRKKVSRIGATSKLKRLEWPTDSEKGDDESLFFCFESIAAATDNFSEAKKLGQGGFGPVYKGKLDNGLEVAVKRLNKMTVYGAEQFRNEVTVIFKLQHRNLVKLLGYCTHGEERILLYEFLPNKSLDAYLFDARKKDVLNWKARLTIIEGISQGLLYLHKFSRLKIIHRDLKPSNILLDNDMNPKISDFGTARIFGDDELRANTNRIVGTYGYMPPEYAMHGIFSEKSDVFSFGVMILEIITGKKNTAFYDSDRHLNLIGHVWDIWIGGNISDAIDSSLNETIPEPEIQRYVQVGLLCVQEKAADRPTMSEVACMLDNESTVLAPPKRPAFSEIMNLMNTNLPVNPADCSLNKVTISDVEGR